MTARPTTTNSHTDRKVPATVMPTPLIYNLGCGARTSSACVNVDWTPALRLRRNRLGRIAARFVLSGARLEAFDKLDGELVLHDLRRGIPAADGTVDAVYHSHVLEHLDRAHVAGFFAEVQRVLRPGGVHRIVVPDLEQLTRHYLADLERHVEVDGDIVPGSQSDPNAHDLYVAEIVEQMVRREAFGTSQQRPLRRILENRLLGDARRRGETHQWMWDRVNLAAALSSAGFTDVSVVDSVTSSIPGWQGIGLDVGDDGGEYKPGSLYVEARRPDAR